ncbi:MAG: metal-dependent hydrolase [Desulfobacteraceae bacterium]|nr:metal-dependent hydrolase [Desulfobacteraceae bacterium]
MPNKKTHTQIGAISGMAMTICRSDGQLIEDRVLESLGGIIGGYLGGIMPDVLDPPNWPGHRSFTHSVSGGAITLASADSVLSVWENYFRSLSNRFKVRKCEQESDVDRVIFGLLEILSRIAVGIGPGLIAGYFSHLALDCTTPKRLPII